MDNHLGSASALSIEGRAFIDGYSVEAQSQRTLRKVCPIDGTDLPCIAACQSEDVEAAVHAAQSAYRSRIWVDRPVREKKSVMFRLADLMEKHIQELAHLDTLETGRSIKNFLQDSIPKAILSVRWFAEALDKRYEQAIANAPDALAVVAREPLGVVGLITPWNDPLVVAAWKFAPALLMGNSIIIKPAEQSTYSILKVAQLAMQAGVPPGVFNVIPGEGEVAGKALALHKEVAAIFFTGSSAVGKEILTYAGQSNMKKVGLECGGKSPFIVSAQCHRLQKAAAVLAKNIFYNQGQICSAPSRLLVPSEIKNKFLAYLLKEAEAYIPRDPLHMETEVGCLISLSHKQRIEAYIEQARQHGCRILTPAHNPQDLPSPCCLVPTIIDGAPPEARFACEEIFGPVLSIIEYSTLHEAVEIANASRFGLAAAIWTDNLDEAHHVSRRLAAGIVHVNSYGEDDNTVPFGGIKESGIGKDKSMHAFDEYSACKTIWIQFGSGAAIPQNS